MTYVDGFVIPVSRRKLAAYRKMAAAGAKAWKKHGALEYFECAGDEEDGVRRLQDDRASLTRAA